MKQPTKPPRIIIPPVSLRLIWFLIGMLIGHAFTFDAKAASTCYLYDGEDYWTCLREERKDEQDLEELREQIKEDIEEALED